ncbi:hypothetical protein DXG01_005295 [Tephrocybe rancida]|nr:hypothetical protein DXG01_005295 [Tephrocybe rancida]
MRKFAEGLKDSLHGKLQPSHVPSGFNSPENALETSIYRYRKQRGVNFGSWFVLERWITDQPYRFAQAPGQSDLDVARGTNARETLEHHWDNWIVEADWAWVSKRGINAVRIPIGYYHLCGADPSVLRGTSFEKFALVFSGAWARITRAIETASRYGLGILIDLHAAPGKQNNDAHSGTSDPPTFFSDKRSREHTTHVLCALLKLLKAHAASHTPPLMNLIGIELLNEPAPSSDEVLQGWYTSTMKALLAIDPTIPLYLGECWRTDQYADFLTRNPSSSLLVLDHHLYRCFTSSDTSTRVSEHTRALVDPGAHTPSMFARVSEKLGRAGGGIIVGEWSGGLNPSSLTGTSGEQGEFVRAQLALYERCCAGWFFWTYKKQWGGDTGWSMRDSVGGGVFPNRVGLRRKRDIVVDEEQRRHKRDEEKGQALAAHTNYWAQYPGQYEHWRFGDGFMNGWEAGFQFIDSSSPCDPHGRVNELGFRGAWARQTTQDHGKGYWEYGGRCLVQFPC